MTNKLLNKTYWESKYELNKTGWDIGAISLPLKTYFDQLNNKDLKILIPGGGNSYEAEYLYNKGFKNVHVIDIANQPLLNFKNRVPNFPVKNIINDDFFNHNNTYDLIIEQTFFCALNPKLREDYIDKIVELLTNQGKLVGLLFDFQLTEEGPPFGGKKKNYNSLFSNKFNLKTIERCYNSIKPRKDRELFIIAEKKSSKI